MPSFPAPDYRYELAETYAIFPGRIAERSDGEAGRQLRRAVELLSDLVAQYKSVPEYRESLARSHLRLADVLGSSGSLAEAESQCQAAIELEKAWASDFANLPRYRFQLVGALDRLAVIQSANKKPVVACASLEEAIATLKAIQDSGAHPPMRMLLAMQSDLDRMLRQLDRGAKVTATGDAPR